MTETDYDPNLIQAVSTVLAQSPEEDFFILRHPEMPIPPLRHPNAIHKVSRHVNPGRLFVFEQLEYALAQRMDQP